MTKRRLSAFYGDFGLGRQHHARLFVWRRIAIQWATNQQICSNAGNTGTSRPHDVLGADAAVFSLGFRTGEAVLPWWLGALRWPRTNIRWQRGRKEAQVALPPRPAR